MTTFSGNAETNHAPMCCMKKNHTPAEDFNEYIKFLAVTSVVYLASYLGGFNTMCIGSMIVMNVLTFNIGMKYNDIYINKTAVSELDTSSEEEDVDNLSIKQKEQGATVSTPMSESQEQYVFKQLNDVVKATQLRNRGRRYQYMPPSPPLTKNTPCYDELPKVELSVARFSNSHYLHGLDNYD